MKKVLKCSQCGQYRCRMVRGSYIVQEDDGEGISRREDRPKLICLRCLIDRADVMDRLGPPLVQLEKINEVLP